MEIYFSHFSFPSSAYLFCCIIKYDIVIKTVTQSSLLQLLYVWVFKTKLCSYVGNESVCNQNGDLYFVLTTFYHFFFFPKYMYAPDDISFVYGRKGTRLSPTLAAFVNGVAVSRNRLNRRIPIVPCALGYLRSYEPITAAKLQLFPSDL